MTYDKFLELQKDLEPDDVLILVKRVKSSDSEISVIGEADDAVRGNENDRLGRKQIS